jgi:hypothetical protein
MRIINRCKADFDAKFARTVNATAGGRITEIIIRKPHFKADADFRASFEPIGEGQQMKIVILARRHETRETMQDLLAHEVGEMLEAHGENQIVIDGFARNLVNEYRNK